MTSFDQLNNRFERLRSDRHRWENHWQEIRELVNPDAMDFTRASTGGEKRTEQIFDGTAPWALEQLASGLQSFLTSPSDRWFTLCVKDYPDYEAEPEILAWLEMVSDAIFQIYSDPRVNFPDSIHESYQDLGSFGTSVLYQDWDENDGHVTFKSFSLADCYILENSKGMVDTLYRKVNWSLRQIKQEFGEEVLNQKMKDEKDQDKMYEPVHAVFPRMDRVPGKMNKQNKKFGSYWFLPSEKLVLRESGFSEFPYHCPRWTKRAGEVYGRSPAMTCLPDIKLLNAMEKVMIKSAQKLADPPLLVPSDGFTLPIKTAPSSLIFFEAGLAQQDMLKPLETRARPEIAEEKMAQKRQHILRSFYADWITREKKRERQSATEIMDDREEMLQLMAPILGRLQTELLGPLIARTYNFLKEKRKLPPTPILLQRRSLYVGYKSPAAKAQLATKGVAIRRFTQELIPLAQIDPTIMDVLHPDKYAAELAVYMDVSRKILRTPEELEELRDKREKAQQMQQLTEVAGPASQAIKNIADAKEKGMNLTL